MKKVLLITHGHMASGMKSSIAILLGKADHLDVIDAYVDEQNISEQVENYFQTLTDGDQLIACCDLMGGSTFQQLFARYQRPNMHLIAGVNLAILLELLLDPEREFSKVEIETLVQGSREVLLLVEQEPAEEATEEFF